MLSALHETLFAGSSVDGICEHRDIDRQIRATYIFYKSNENKMLLKNYKDLRKMTIELRILILNMEGEPIT